MKIAVSDQHIQPFKAEKFKTQRRNFVEILIQKFTEFFGGRTEKMYQLMADVIKAEKISIGIFNGDFMESSATERGLYTERDLEVVRHMLATEKAKLGLEEIQLNMGNHESGYNLPLSTDPQCGISKKSVENFLALTERDNLYYSFKLDGYTIIFVPYIFSEDTARDFDLQKEKDDFLLKFQSELESSDRVILFVHDPDSFDDKQLIKLVRENRQAIKMIFYGHYHSWINLFFTKLLILIYTRWFLIFPRWFFFNPIIWLAAGRDKEKIGKISKYFRKRRNIPRIIKELDAILIPAPGGMYGIGGGFYVINLSDNGSYRIEKHSL